MKNTITNFLYKVGYVMMWVCFMVAFSLLFVGGIMVGSGENKGWIILMLGVFFGVVGVVLWSITERSE